MPVAISAILEQENRTQNVTGDFFHLIDSANINFKVDGIVGSDSTRYDYTGTPVTTYDTKYIYTDIELFVEGWGIALPAGIGVGDIVRRNNSVWELFTDVSNSRTNEGIIVYNKHDNKVYIYDGSKWEPIGAGAAAGAVGSVQYKAANGSLSGSSSLLFNTSGQLVLGANTVLKFADGATVSTPRNFFGITGATLANFPTGMSGAGFTGDRLIVATGPATDPFRNYVRFGNAWVQTGVVGIGGGIQGLQGATGATGTNGTPGAVGATGATGTNGTNGTNGATGATGTNGAPGAVGATGTTGVNGTNGVTGQGGGLPYRWRLGETPQSLADGGVSVRSVTGFNIHEKDFYGFLQTGYLQTWDDTKGTVKGNIIVRARETSGVGTTGSIIFQVNSVFYANPTYQFVGNLLVGQTGAGTFADLNREVFVNFIPKGDSLEGIPNTGLTHASQNNLGTDTGLARKVAFLLEDGSLTFDFVRNYDVFRPSDFLFSTNTFAFGNQSQNVLISNANYPLSGTFSVNLNAGPALTAQVTVEESTQGVGFPLYFDSLASSTALSKTIPGGVSITAAVGGSVTIRLRATGAAAGNLTDTETLTYTFSNHLISGVTSASSLTGSGLTGTWVTRTLTESLDQTFQPIIPNGHYFFFAYPKRLGNSYYQINDIGQGAVDAQGYGSVPGVSSNSYSNMSGYTEDYFIYRTSNAGIGSVKIDTGSDPNQL